MFRKQSPSKVRKLILQEQTLKEQTLLELEKTKREYDQVYQQMQTEREETERELAHARLDADAAMEARAVAIRQREVVLKEVAEIRLEREIIALTVTAERKEIATLQSKSLDRLIEVKDFKLRLEGDLQFSFEPIDELEKQLLTYHSEVRGKEQRAWYDILREQVQWSRFGSLSAATRSHRSRQSHSRSCRSHIHNCSCHCSVSCRYCHMLPSPTRAALAHSSMRLHGTIPAPLSIDSLIPPPSLIPIP